MAPTKSTTKAPDTTEYDSQMASFKSCIDDLQDQVRAITKEISEKSVGKKEYQDKKNDMVQKLQEYQEIINKLENERRGLRDTDNEARKQLRDQNNAMDEKKKKLPYSSVDQIDRKIREVEYSMQIKSMSLKEEKAKLVEISELKKIRPEVAKVLREEASRPGGDAGNRDRIEELNEEIKKAREAKKKQQEQKDKLIENRKNVTSGMDDLFKGRDELNKKISQHIQARQQVRDDFNEKKREWAAQQAEQRASRKAKQEADSLNRQADQKKRQIEDMAADEDVNPNSIHIIAYQQAIIYCTNLIKEEEKVEEEVVDTVHTNPEGYAVLGTKKQRADDFSYIAAKGLRAKKLRMKGKENKVTNSSPIKHNLLTIETFSKLAVAPQSKWNGIIPPNTRDDVPAILEILNERLAKFQELVKVWEDDRLERKAALDRTIKEAEEKASELRAQAKQIHSQVLEEAARKEARDQAIAA